MSGSNALTGGGIPAPTGASTINPLQMLQGMDALKTQQAKNALQGIYQATTDPTTGQVDTARFNALVANSPQASYLAGPTMQQQGAAQQAQASAQNTQTSGHIARLTYMAGLMGPLLAQDGPVKADQITKAIQQAHDVGILPQGDVNTVLRDFNNTNPPNGDYRQWVQQHMNANQSATDTLNSSLPKYDYVDTGAGLQLVMRPPFGAAPGPTGAGITKTLTPGQANDIVDLVQPGRDPQPMLRSQAIEALRTNPQLAPLNTGWLNTAAPAAGAAAGAPPAGSAGGAPRPPPLAPTPPSAAPFVPTAARADTAGTAAGTPTGAPQFGTPGTPGQLKTREAQATAGSQQAQVLEAQGQDATTKVQPLLAGMLTEIQGTGSSGITSVPVGRIRQLAIAAGIAPPALDVTNTQANQEALGKLFAQYEAQQLGALGSSPSDSRQSLAAAGSPSLFNTPEGNRQIIRNLQGNNDALDTMYRAWMGSNTRATNPGNFAAWRSAFTAPVASGPLAGARFDPTVFAVNRMNPAQQRTYLTNLRTASPGDYAQYSKDWELARKEGWVNAYGSNTPSQ